MAAVTQVYEAGASHGARRGLIIEIPDRASLGAMYRHLSRAFVKWYHEDLQNSVRGSKNTINDYMWSRDVIGSARASTALRRSWIRDWRIISK